MTVLAKPAKIGIVLQVCLVNLIVAQLTYGGVLKVVQLLAGRERPGLDQAFLVHCRKVATFLAPDQVLVLVLDACQRQFVKVDHRTKKGLGLVFHEHQLFVQVVEGHLGVDADVGCSDFV